MTKDDILAIIQQEINESHRLRCILLGCWYGTIDEPMICHDVCFWCREPRKHFMNSPSFADKLGV